MKVLLLCILFSAASAVADPIDAAVEEYVDSLKLTFLEKQKVKAEAKKQAYKMRDELQDGRLDRLARFTDRTAQYFVERAADVLEKNGEADAAYFYRSMYRFEYRDHFERMLARDIGDHAGFFQFIDDLYLKVVSVIGVAAAKALHLSDAYTLNHSNVTFKPCSFPMDNVPGTPKDEYRRHFAEGATYYGTLPVVSYWLINIPLMATGVGMLAGPIASAAEYAIAKTVAPKLSDFVYEKACN